MLTIKHSSTYKFQIQKLLLHSASQRPAPDQQKKQSMTQIKNKLDILTANGHPSSGRLLVAWPYSTYYNIIPPRQHFNGALNALHDLRRYPSTFLPPSGLGGFGENARESFLLEHCKGVLLVVRYLIYMKSFVRLITASRGSLGSQSRVQDFILNFDSDNISTMKMWHGTCLHAL